MSYKNSVDISGLSDNYRLAIARLVRYIEEFNNRFDSDLRSHIDSSLNVTIWDTFRAGRYAGRDILSWSKYQVFGHLGSIFDICVPVEQIRYVDGQYTEQQSKEIERMNKALEAGKASGDMWVALVNPNVPLNILYKFAQRCAMWDGYTDLSSGGDYIQGFLLAFNDYQIANKPMQVTDKSQTL